MTVKKVKAVELLDKLIDMIEDKPDTEPCEDCISRKAVLDIGCNGNVAPYRIGATTNIKELGQEPNTDVLDKIRAEIQENINYNKKMNYQGIVAGLLLALDIINKYKAESEEV